ncbi:unnamed protein product [Linum tenue]|uniref:Proton pump-interactor 1 n=1 Tax=Linum tenue TaxID=586396 RepID=A0AAV0JKF0_9ROSI|nr:unnamed protein product [Linum tenue]
MGVEVVVASDVAAQVPIDAVTEVEKSILHEMENGEMNKGSAPNEAIKFGSDRWEVEKGVGTDADTEARRNAVGEWPTSDVVHVFYFPKILKADNSRYRLQIEEVDREITKNHESWYQARDRLRPLKDARSVVVGELKELRTRFYDLKDIMGDKRKEMQPLQQALGKLQNNSNGHGGIFTSEEELDEAIRRLQYYIQHESIPLSEEKQVLREIAQLKGQRPNIIANVAMRAKIQESMGQKDDIQDQVKHMNVDFDGLKKERDAMSEKIKKLNAKVEALDEEIKVIEEEQTAIRLKRDELLVRLGKLRALSDELNAPHLALRGILNQAKQLAVKKDAQGIQQLANAEMEKFMLQWREKAFRDDYEKRLIWNESLDERKLTRDGRTRNPDEKPIAVVMRPAPSQVEPLVKPLKRPEESLPAKKVQKKTEQIEEAEDEVAGLEKIQQKTLPQVDAAKLKEMKREEEIAKAKLAMERKKKLAEKAAAKAAKRAEKEAEKKLKDREKKLKKKTAGSGSWNEEDKVGEESVEESEPEETKGAAAPAPVKEQVKKENPARYRNRPRSLEAVPRALLKKKKSINYWLWAAPAALLAVFLVFLACCCLL